LYDYELYVQKDMKGGACSLSEVLFQNQPGESDENHENPKLASKKSECLNWKLLFTIQ
jgi:hypothetical protein